MKTNFVVMAFTALILGLCCMSCEKSNQNCDSTLKAKTSDFVMHVSYDKCSDVYIGKDITQPLEWIHYDEKDLNVGTVLLAYEDWKDANFICNKDSSMIVTKETDTVWITNIYGQKDYLSFTAQGHNNRAVEFSIFAKQYDFSNINAMSDQKVAPEALAALLFAAAGLIAHGIDMYCDKKIQNDVADCTAHGQCSIVHSCSASCVTCRK